MRVFIDALSARLGGGQTYLLNFLESLPALNGSEVFVLAPTSLELPTTHPNVKRVHTNWPVGNPFLRVLWERVFLPRLLHKLEVGVLFCPGGVISTTPPRNCLTVTMFRNMIPFDLVQRSRYNFGYARTRNWALEKIMLGSMVSADLVIFISQYARRVIEQRAPGMIRHSVVMPHGVSDHFRISDARALPRPRWLPRENYLLYVSTIDVYKAQIEVVRGFALLKQRRKTTEKLVLAGSENPQYGQAVRDEIARLALQDDVIVAGYVPYGELPQVYQHALINIFASESENCPNILLEAMASGRPVIASNFPPMPEFGGDAVVYFDPRSPEDFANKLEALIDDPQAMAALSEKAKARSRDYNWRHTVAATWQAIEDLYRDGKCGLVIHAPNVHQGGGRALLLDMLKTLDARSNCKVILDARLELPAPLPQNVSQVRVNHTVWGRLMAEWTLRNLATPNDAVLCFGNLPPLFRIKSRLFVFLQNRYLIGKVSLSRLPVLKRLQVLVERVWLRWRVRDVDSIIVQTPTMQREVLRDTGVKAAIMPFSQNLRGYCRRIETRRNLVLPEYDFLYVASGDPHKNHVQLIEAWKLLAHDGMYPSLQLTVQDATYPRLLAWIEEQKQRYQLHIDNRSLKPTQDVGELYDHAGALIYPSTLESLGLPLIEARVAGLPILAPELDYVRDLVDPEQTFDPNSPVSIARAVKRHLSNQEQPLPLVSPQAFVRQVTSRPGQPEHG